MVSATPDRLLEVAHWLEAAGDSEGAKAVLSEGMRWAPEDPPPGSAVVSRSPREAKAELERLLADAAAFSRYGLPEKAFQCLRDALGLEAAFITPAVTVSLDDDA